MKTCDSKKRFPNIQFVMLITLMLALLSNGCQSNQGTQFTRQTAQATVFAPAEQPAVVELLSAQADSQTLTITLAISGLDILTQPLDLDNLVCDPYLQTGGHVSLSSFYRETEFPDQADDPIILTYRYGMDSGDLKELHIRLDLTIGPCGPDLQEMLVTPAPKSHLIANYVFDFVVPIEE